jgi:hypothetical protein
VANSYYLIAVDKLEPARTLAPTQGAAHQLFQFCICPNAPKAIVQADWLDDAAIAAVGTYLGDLQPDGSAPQAVYEELSKLEWQSPMEGY